MRVQRAALSAGAASVALALALFAPSPSVRAAAPSCDVDGVDRIVAVGDVHGAYDRFLEILQAARVMDARARWTGGRTHLVQLGDIVDRGADARKALDLLRSLES